MAQQKVVKDSTSTLTSYQNAFGEHLLPFPNSFNSELEAAKAIFSMNNPVMCHDRAKDPYLNYANQAALQIWDRSWNEIIGMPSRLTAPEGAQKTAKYALNQAIKKHACKNYQGIRVISKGELFIIKNARIWTLWDENGNTIGQAPTFDYWSKI